MNDIFENGKKLPLIDEFYTIQGEGYNTGKPAYFIRLGGCDIACSWCDTKISWKADVHKLADYKEIVAKVIKTPAKSIVVTGGEPTSYNLDFLSEELQKNNIETFLETSGAYKISGIWDWICLSPKKQQAPLEENYAKAHEIKMIIAKPADIDWAEECSHKVGKNCKLYLQPEWSVREEMTNLIVEYAKNNPKWNLSIQMHKYVKIP